MYRVFLERAAEKTYVDSPLGFTIASYPQFKHLPTNRVRAVAAN